MEECSSVDHFGSLLTICSNDKYQSICFDDKNGHVNCSMTMDGLFSIDKDLQHFFIPYGTVAWINNIIGLWIWTALVVGKAPLNPNRTIKHKNLVILGGIAWIVFMAVTAIVKIPKMTNRDLKTIAAGHVVAAVIVKGAVLCLMKQNTIGLKGSKEGGKEEEKNEKATDEPSEAAEKNNIPQRPSLESTRSSSSTSTIASVSEKTGFLDNFTSKIPGIQKTENKPAAEDTNSDASKKEETAAEGSGLGLGNFLMGIIGLSPGHIMMFYGVVGIAKKAFVGRQTRAMRQKREVRDSFILFGLLVGVSVIIGILGVVGKVSADAKQSEDEESADREARKKERAAEMKGVKEAVIFGVFMLAGLFSLWCQYFVIAAVARDTHGTAHLGQTSNMSLVFIILSKLFFFAF